MSQVKPGFRQPYMAGCRGYGMGMRSKNKAMQAGQILAGGVQLLGIPGAQTFARATSAWDPASSQIRPPGYLRTKLGSVSPTLMRLDALIEGVGTNLLAAGTSDRFDLWSSITAQLVGGQVAPDGSLTAWNITDSSAGAFQSIQQTVTIPNNALAYIWSLFVLKTSGGTSATFGINYAINGGTPITASGRFNTDTGTILNGAGGFAVSSAGAYWRISMVLTNNTSGNTTVNIAIFPATAANGQVVDSAAAVGTATIAWAQLEQSLNPTSYISCRNLQTQTQRYDNGTWTKTDTTITPAAITGPLSGLIDGQLVAEGVAGTGALLNIGVLVTASGAYSTSAYFKRGNHDFILLQASNGAINSGFRQWFNINLGTAGTSQAFGTGTFTGGTITNVGGGWYRISISGTIGAFTSFVQTSQSASADASATRVNNAQRYMYGSQTEPGTTATTYWGVNATVGGRDLENDVISLASLAGGGLSTTAGTLVAYFTPYGWSGSAGGVTSIICDDITTTAVTTMDTGTAGIAASQRKDTVSSKVAPGPAGTPANGVMSCIASVWDGAHLTTYLNGVAGTPTATAPPYVLTTGLQLGAAKGLTLFAYGYVSLFYIPRALTAAEITALAVSAGF